jgi:hypothetical protein
MTNKIFKILLKNSLFLLFSDATGLKTVVYNE